MTYRVPLGQTEIGVTISDRGKILIGIGALALGAGLGWLGYRYPVPSFGARDYGSGAFMEFGGGGRRHGGGTRIGLRLNRRRRRR